MQSNITTGTTELGPVLTQFAGTPQLGQLDQMLVVVKSDLLPDHSTLIGSNLSLRNAAVVAVRMLSDSQLNHLPGKFKEGDLLQLLLGSPPPSLPLRVLPPALCGSGCHVGVLLAFQQQLPRNLLLLLLLKNKKVCHCPHL